MHQIAVARLVLRQEDNFGAPGGGFAPAGCEPGAIAEIQRQFDADNRLDAFFCELFRKFQRAEKIVAVGDRQRRHTVGDSQLGQFGDRKRPFAQGEGTMDVKMHKADGRGDGRKSRSWDRNFRLAQTASAVSERKVQNPPPA